MTDTAWRRGIHLHGMILLGAYTAAGLLACSGEASPEPTDPAAGGQAAAATAGATSFAGASGAPTATAGATAMAGATSSAGSSASGGAPGASGAETGGVSGVGGGATVGGTAGAATGGAAVGGAAGAATGGASSGEVPLDPALLGKCTGTSPIACAFDVPANGNYTVTVELGGPAMSTSRVQAEEHRISVPTAALAAGARARHTFSLNVREEKHDGYGAPGKILNLLIDNGTYEPGGPAPALSGVGFAATPNIPTIFVAGDSTVCDWEPTYAATKAGPLERGWAQELSQFLKPGVAVANYADSGETASGFYGKFWPPAKATLREGDYVFVQFGHNDQKDFTAEQFKANLLKYVNDARSAKATPILLTPVGRKSAKASDYGFAGLDQATRDLAAAEKVTLIDLTALTVEFYATLPDKSVMFATSSESTHFSEHGATEVSRLVAAQLKASALPLAKYVK